MGFSQQMTAHLEQNASAYLVTEMVLIVVLLVAAILLFLRLKSLSRPFSRVRELTEDPAALLQAVMQTAEQTESNIARLDRKLDAHLDDSKSFLRRIGLVRYDAFDDIAGMQSFSLCLLNGEGDGVLITYLTGKKSTRSYAVTVERGRASRELSDEERRALDEARSTEAIAAQA